LLKKPEQATANIANNSAHARIAKLDNVKFLLIMSVVIGHFCDPYARYSSFLDSVRILRLFLDMPAFIFISGLFCKKLYSKYSPAQPSPAQPSPAQPSPEMLSHFIKYFHTSISF